MKLLISVSSYLVSHPVLSGVGTTLTLTLFFVIVPVLAAFLFAPDYYKQSYSDVYPLLTFYSLVHLLLAPIVIYSLWIPGARRRFYGQFTEVIDQTEGSVKGLGSAGTNLSWVWYAVWSAVTLAATIPLFLTGRTIGISWWLFWIPMWAYFSALAVTYVNSVVAMRWLSMFLRPNELKVVPLHPDRCGGLSFVGEYFAKIYSFVVYFGLTLMLGLLLFMTYEERLDLTASNLGLGVTYIASTALYIGGVYFALIRPTRWIQAAMKKPRDRILLQLAGEVNLLQLSLSDLASVKSAENAARFKDVDEEIQRLRNLYQAVQATYPTSPFPATWLRGIRASSVIPLLVGVAPIVITLLKDES